MDIRPSAWRGARVKKMVRGRLRFRPIAVAALLAGFSTAGAAHAQSSASCAAPASFSNAASLNGRSLAGLVFAPFGRTEQGWATYGPIVAQEIGTACPPASAGFAAALSRWQARHGQRATGVMDAATFQALKTLMQQRRPFVVQSRRLCPAPPPAQALAQGRASEGYGGKAVVLHHQALTAYRRMVADARAQSAAIRRDPRVLTIFSSYRSPHYDAGRCARDGNCDGVRRATCSPHRTGYAVDLYLGQAPGYGPDSTSDPNRRHLSATPAYRWLVRNASRYGFRNYPFEPWHWEWSPNAN